MDYKVILNLMKEMNNTDLTKLEIEENGLKIIMEKANSVAQSAPLQRNTAMQPSSETEIPVNMSPVAGTAADKQTEEVGTVKLVSPMVGTFYTSSSPDKPPFVKVGDRVKKGQTVCIIEAMKLMNEIESEHDGEIVKILVNNEQMVEYGQPLFLIK